MSAPDQLTLFEPDASDALRLLRGYVGEVEMHMKQADRFELLQMPGAAARSDALASEAARSALVLAFYLDLLRESGEVAL
jgi:hypothetical protein